MWDEGITDVFGDVFSCWVELIEGWCCVEVDVGQRLEDAIHVLLNEVEIAQQAIFIQLGPPYCYGDAPVVAMHGFTPALDGDGVRGAEFTCDSQFKHDWIVTPEAGGPVWLGEATPRREVDML